ncbi:hypothetical protein [Paludibacterium purpuratum]|uniref:Uncharacterized protein n=1 Tax=Paludibacterium purpuratum TaxID=1144873 RepID=A0A4V3DVA8_9NEIS|nr:hypothetical protein [Paludibacterium purpuratum]TDR80229.1 hypothetical protein DFP86_10584 [Paludibacterium purpuratum]
MATRNVNPVPVFSQNQDSHPQQLFSLFSMLSLPRRSRPNSDKCRLIVDNRLFWAFEPIDANMSWMFLPEGAHVRRLANCLILTAD